MITRPANSLYSDFEIIWFEGIPEKPVLGSVPLRFRHQKVGATHPLRKRALRTGRERSHPPRPTPEKDTTPTNVLAMRSLSPSWTRQATDSQDKPRPPWPQAGKVRLMDWQGNASRRWTGKSSNLPRNPGTKEIPAKKRHPRKQAKRLSKQRHSTKARPWPSRHKKNTARQTGLVSLLFV